MALDDLGRKARRQRRDEAVGDTAVDRQPLVGDPLAIQGVAQVVAVPGPPAPVAGRVEAVGLGRDAEAVGQRPPRAVEPLEVVAEARDHARVVVADAAGRTDRDLVFVVGLEADHPLGRGTEGHRQSAEELQQRHAVELVQRGVAVGVGEGVELVGFAEFAVGLRLVVAV